MDEVRRENIEWCDIWLTQAAAAKQPRVLMIGDSITRGYYPAAAAGLKEHYACARLATSKCVGDPVLIKELDLVLGEYEYEVVHFNNGMHGWDYSEDEYAVGLASVMVELIARAPKSRFICATTTPVRSRGKLEGLDDKTERVRERNRIACQLAAEHGMGINDLFGLVVDHPEYHCDAVHFNDEGTSVMGAHVAEVILASGMAV